LSGIVNNAYHNYQPLIFNHFVYDTIRETLSVTPANVPGWVSLAM